MAELTDRQLEVLRLVGQGKSTKEIATSLKVSDNVVEHEIGDAMATLGARSRIAAVVKALKLGLLSLDEVDV